MNIMKLTINCTVLSLLLAGASAHAMLEKLQELSRQNFNAAPPGSCVRMTYVEMCTSSRHQPQQQYHWDPSQRRSEPTIEEIPNHTPLSDEPQHSLVAKKLARRLLIPLLVGSCAGLVRASGKDTFIAAVGANIAARYYRLGLVPATGCFAGGYATGRLMRAVYQTPKRSRQRWWRELKAALNK